MLAAISISADGQVKSGSSKPVATDGQACTDIETVDFKNRVIVTKDDVFKFHNGVFDDGEMVEGKFLVDWRSEIVKDTVVHPVSSVSIRFVEVFQNHLLGTGSFTHLFAFRCSGGTIRMVFYKSGEGMEATNVSPTALRLRFGVWRYSDAHCCPSLEKHSLFVWDGAKATFVLKQERLTNRRDPP
jgi:hypothetical protein